MYGIRLNEAYTPGGKEPSVLYDPLVLKLMQGDLEMESQLAQLVKLFVEAPPHDLREVI